MAGPNEANINSLFLGAARYGDANENGNAPGDPLNNDDRRQTRDTKQRFQTSGSSWGQQEHEQQQQQRPTTNGPATFTFRPFTKESLIQIRKRQELNNNSRGSSKRRKTKIKSQLQLAAQAAAQAASVSSPLLDPNNKLRKPDPCLASGQQLPPALVRQLPPELIGRPIEDIDPFYEDQETFVIISRGKELTRFSAKKALYLFGPFHPIRQVVLYILVSPLFNLVVILTILINCILMTIQGSETVEQTEIIFTIVYTTEMGLKVMARGFILDDFTYLRDQWNWLDFAVIIMAYLTIVVKDLGNLSVMRTFRVLRALKTVAIIPGMKTIVGAVIDSVKNLKDVVVLTLFSLSVFSLLGLQIYMGILTQKCILNSPLDNMTDAQWFAWNNDPSHWIPEPDDEIFGAYRLCGNATGAQTCPEHYTCLQGFGPNPDYGYTNFDTFGWSLICSFRLMTQDFWEGLYMQVLKTAGSWHISFFVVSIFLGSIYLMNLILAIVAMSYNELQRRAEQEEEAAAQDEAAFLESCRLLELQDQMSQMSLGVNGTNLSSGDSPDAPGTTSYRPSVEIGLVGQSLLASLCQNGLLGQQVRDKLDQQVILASQFPFGGPLRSHSLCVNLERRQSAMSQPTNVHTGAPGPVQVAGGLGGPYKLHEPLTMAASMTELRRKSSVRTNESACESPTFNNRNQVSQPAKSHLGQRRLLPNIGLAGNRLDGTTNERRSSSRSLFHTPITTGSGQSNNNTASNRLNPQYLSSGVISMSREPAARSVDEKPEPKSPGRQQTLGCSFVKRFPGSRSSTTSDRDLQVLKQKAAMIRIEDQLERHHKQAAATSSWSSLLSEEPAAAKLAGELHVDRRGHLASVRRRQSDNTSGARYGSADLHRGHSNKSPSQLFGSAEQAEVAICEQPTSAQPFGGVLASNQMRHLSMSGAAGGAGVGQRRPSSIRRQVGGRRTSTMSNIEQNSRLAATKTSLLADGPAASAKLGGSAKTLRSNLNTSTSNTNTTVSSYGPAGAELAGPSPGHPRLHLRPEARKGMHHLSVENFQQFGSVKPAGPKNASQQSLQSVDCSIEQPGNLLPLAGSQTNQEQYSLEAQQQQQLQQDLSAASGQLRGRLGSRHHIHPSTMVRSSFSRPRPPVQLASGQAGGGSNHLGRRVSRDFVRRASDWSRLSMSANVDLRRLLKLWSHTNPYQGGAGPRQSFGSCSQYSQGAQSVQMDEANLNRNNSNLMMMMMSESQQRTGQAGEVNANSSPRPSSVGSAWQAYEFISAMSRGRRDRYQSVGYGAMPLDDNLMDRMSINWRDKCLAYCLSCLDILCIWECCGTWLTIQRIIAQVVFDPFTELFIIFCILINTLFMALDSDDTDDQMRNIFESGNYFFTGTFAVEALMKIMALSPKFYFREGWNVFDAVIVALSLLELCLEGVYGLSVLRSFRLLRVFKLAKSWPTLNLLISIMGKAVGDLGNLTFVLAIIVFIFAVMGMQLFGKYYEAKNFPSGQLPRWNFTDFMHSFMIVFRILCAEWIEPMWDCLNVGGWPCIPFFLIAVTVGNLVVLNLFLALLLASFGASNLSSPQADNVDTKKLQEAIGRFRRFACWLRRRIGQALGWLASCLMCKWRRKTQRQQQVELARVGPEVEGTRMSPIGSQASERPLRSHIVSMSRLERLQNIEKRTEELKNKIRRSPEHHYHLRQLAKSQRKLATAATPTVGEGQPQVIVTSQSPSLGYNYNYAFSGLNVGFGSQRMVPTNIPIIVNEAAEPSADEEEGEEDDDDHEDVQLDDGRGYTKRQQQLDGQSEQEVLSNASSLSDVSFQPGDFNVAHAGGQLDLEGVRGGRYAPTSPGSSSQVFVGSRNHSMVAGYANNMQPIREDSKDESGAGSRPSQSSADSFELVDPTPATGGDGYQDERGTRLAKAKSNPEGLSQTDRQRPPESTSMGPANVQQKAASNLHLPPVGESALVEVQQTNDDGDAEADSRPKSSLYLRAPKTQEMEEDDEKTLQHIETYIEKCIWFGIICLKWFLFRQYVRKIVEHRYFDQCILTLIVISSGTLALEDKHLNDRPALKQTLDVLDTIFTIIFSLEMVCKWLAFGMRRYFGNIWTWLDFLIVLVSFINLMASIFGSGKIQALKTMRTLRAMRGLRPLRALQRFQGMRVVVNALIQAIPSIFNVLLVCLIFWLIFSIMGVQMFGGKFWRCLDPITRERVDYTLAANKVECLAANLTWSNPQINFDNVLNAYLALFQVATFKGWIDIMNSATDSRQRDEQPIREANIYMYSYFVFFVIFGSFFTLNLFIGVIIDNFNEQKKKTGGSLEIFMTDDQKKYYHAMKKMRSKKPIKAMTRPKFTIQAYMFDITTSKKFDLAIMLIIGLNMFVMALEHYGQSQEFSAILENLNLLFIAIFSCECLCKIFAMRHFYFREPWNIFDFIVVSLSILGVVMKEYVAKYFVSPTLLRVVRVVKVGRVLRLVKGAKGIRTLLFALAMSLPALFNICLLLFLVMFIYAIFGMSFFMNVRKRSGIDETFNFETFSSSIIILFQMSTSAGWDLVLDPLMDEENDCQKPDPVQGIEGTCGNKAIAIAYLISYVIVTFLIIINMYIAVILENYSQATEDVQEGLTDDDYEMYYEIWQKFDPNGTQYLPYNKLSDFVDALEDPLRIPKPNELALVVLDINIYEGDQCYCVDILDALTKCFFTRKGYVIQVNEHLQQVQSTLHETPFERVTTTYLLKREHYCAKVIQNCWRRWKERTRKNPDGGDHEAPKEAPPTTGDHHPAAQDDQTAQDKAYRMDDRDD